MEFEEKPEEILLDDLTEEISETGVEKAQTDLKNVTNEEWFEMNLDQC